MLAIKDKWSVVTQLNTVAQPQATRTTRLLAEKIKFNKGIFCRNLPNSALACHPAFLRTEPATSTPTGPHCNSGHLRLATTHIAGIQACISNSVLLAQPSQKSLQTNTVAAVRRTSVPSLSKLVKVPRQHDSGSTYLRWSKYQ